MKTVLIIGTGVAGLSVARTLPESVRAFIFSKGDFDNGATPLAQGGIAVPVGSDDSVELHIEDTMRAGHYTNNLQAVETIIGSAEFELIDLLSIGFSPDRNPDGSLNLGLEGGHSKNRIVHAQDRTGKHLHEVLLNDVKRKQSITFKSFINVTSLITNDNRVVGIEAIDTKKKEAVFYLGDAIVLATGGVGALFSRTTNPESATGDGLYLALKVDAQLSNIDKIQWHPTAFVEDNNHRMRKSSAKSMSAMPLITEALRGAGAKLIDADGKDVVPLSLHELGCLAPRDVVTRACYESMIRTNSDRVFLDARGINKNILHSHFPGVINTCMLHGINPEKDLIPVAPAAHYHCGGVTTDLNGKTSVEGLYAVGECADTGLHGDNRLASNSLLEGLVMGRRCASYINKRRPHINLDVSIFKE